MDFQMTMRRYGPTVHLTDDEDVVACNTRCLTFMDVVGLHGLTAFARRLNERGTAFFAYDWQPQPLRLMDLVDGFHPKGDRSGPTGLLRRALQGSAAAACAAGAIRVRRDAPHPAGLPPVRGGAVIRR